MHVHRYRNVCDIMCVGIYAIGNSLLSSNIKDFRWKHEYNVIVMNLNVQESENLYEMQLPQ